jgi:hypothetical protein
MRREDDMRREKTGLPLLLTFLLLLGCSAVYSRQGGEQLAAEVARVRSELQELERASVPAGRAERHRSIIEDKRIRLHGLLQQQRDELSSYRDLLVRNRAAQSEVRQVEQDIESKEAEMSEVKSTLRASLSGAPSVPDPPRASEPRAVEPAPQPVLPQAMTPPLSTPATPPAPAEEKIDAPTAISALTAAGADGKETLDSCSLFNTPQENQLSKYEVAICKLVQVIRQDKEGDPLNPIPGSFDPRATFTLNQEPAAIQAILAAKLIRSEERAKFLLAAEEARTDKQVGGGSSNSGSTSLVVKGGAPTVLGFAVENGALIQTRSGTTVTFRGNPIGIFKFLNGRGFDESYLEDENDPSTRFLKKLSFSTSFDTDRGATPGVFTADKQQLSAYSFRYEFVNERDPRHRKHQAAWARFIAEQGVGLTQAVASAYDALTIDPVSAGVALATRKKFRDPVLQAWLEETQKLIAAAAPAEVESVFKSQLEKFPASDKVTEDTRQTIRGFTDAFAAYVQAREKLLKEIAKGSVITFEYTNQRQINAPDLSNLRFIAETGLFKGNADLTANASFTMFNSRPAAGANRIRDFQFAAQFDAPIKLRNMGNFVFSFAGKYQRSLEDATALDGTVIPNTKGDIAVGQLKLTLPFLEGSGIRFPISLTFSNRTELVREKEVRGNFGLTFDLDKILAKFKPF